MGIIRFVVSISIKVVQFVCREVGLVLYGGRIFQKTSLFYLDLHGAWGESSDFFLHPVTDTRVHGGTAGQHVVSVQIFTDVDVALHDAVVGGLMNARRLHTYSGESQCK